MLEVTTHTPSRLVLRDRRTRLRIFSIGFTLLSVISLVMLLANSVQLLVIEGGLDLQRLPAQIVFITIGFSFVGFGVFLMMNPGRGLTVIFDRDAEIVTIHSSQNLRPYIEEHSIYGVSHLRVERNDELRMFGLFLVLRAGGRTSSGQIPLTTIPYHEQAHMEDLVHRVSNFLKY